jgi:chromosome segregation ATPase
MDTAIKTPSAGQVVEGLTVLTPDKQVKIGEGEYASLGALMACRDPHCNLCTEGWLRIATRPGYFRSAVCGCCVSRFRKRRAAARREEVDREEVVVAPPGVAVQKARLERRVTRLGEAVAAIEENIAKREQAATAAIGRMEEETRRHAAAAQDYSSGVIRARAEAERIEGEISEAETRLGNLRLARQGALAVACADQQAAELAAALQQDIAERIAARRAELSEETRGLRRDLERAKRRLGTAVNYNREAFGE